MTLRRRHIACVLSVLGVLSMNIVSSWAAAREPVDSIGVVETTAFLEQYRSLGETQSLDFYDLYSDRASVHAHVEGQPKGLVFQGRAYKQWGRDLLRNGHALLDASVFRDATVEQRGSRLVVRAKRYSTVRCYWDSTYQVGIEKEGMSYRIVEERLTLNPGARCDARTAGIRAGTAADAPTTATTPNAAVATSDASGDASWHPMSQDEIAAAALRIAQQTAAQYPPFMQTTASPAIGVSSASADSPSSKAERQKDPPSELWVTP